MVPDPPSRALVQVAEPAAESSTRERGMKRLSRPNVLGGGVATAAAPTMGAPSVLDRTTFTLELAERFGPVLDALGKNTQGVLKFIAPVFWNVKIA
jgi:hypothetical protein